MSLSADTRFMSAAIALAREQLGRTRPNPAVGCVLVKAGRVIATGQTADQGRPHAERIALDRAERQAEGAHAYVTLEPCAHHGQTPPCAEALVEARVERVIIACQDEDPRVMGRGVEILRSAGIEVETGVLQHLAEPLYSGFFHRIRTGHPQIIKSLPRPGFDADLPVLDAHELEGSLDALGAAGAARIRLDPKHPLADALIRTGRAVSL